MEPNDLFMVRQLGMQTLVGGGKKERPDSSGNCFSVHVNEVTREDFIAGKVDEYRIVNFNVENLNALLKLGLKWPIQCKFLGGRTAIIHDPRIGERWYDKRFCEVCCPKEFLPVPQLQSQEREVMRGFRKEHEKYVELNLGGKAEFE